MQVTKLSDGTNKGLLRRTYPALGVDAAHESDVGEGTCIWRE